MGINQTLFRFTATGEIRQKYNTYATQTGEKKVLEKKRKKTRTDKINITWELIKHFTFTATGKIRHRYNAKTTQRGKKGRNSEKKITNKVLTGEIRHKNFTETTQT